MCQRRRKEGALHENCDEVVSRIECCRLIGEDDVLDVRRPSHWGKSETRDKAMVKRTMTHNVGEPSRPILSGSRSGCSEYPACSILKNDRARGYPPVTE